MSGNAHRYLTTLVTVITVMLTPVLAYTGMCNVDPVPAATLLLPYFEVDIGDSNDNGSADCAEGTGVTTLVEIHNTFPRAALVHVTLWTDWAWPSVDFDVFLTGYDTQSINLCEILANGSLPVTADLQNDPDDTISPNDGHNERDGSFPNCAGFFPFPDPIITGGLRDRVQNAHAGYPIPSLGDDCTGEGLNGAGACIDGVCPANTLARGYVTFDNSNGCSTQFPSDPASPSAYFADGGDGVVSNSNQLWGVFQLLDPAKGTASGGVLTAVEGNDTFNATSTTNGETFYGRYPTATGGADNREPLGTISNTQILGGGAVSGGTSLLVWRDTADGTVNPNDGWACGQSATAGIGPSWAPLGQTEILCVNEFDNKAELPCASDPACIPLATQRLQVGAVDGLNVSFDSGSCRLNLNLPPASVNQSVVFALHQATGVYSAASPSTVTAHACNAQCIGDGAGGDSDNDGLCDNIDVCAGFDDNSHTDTDTVPDGCDVAPADPLSCLDSDNDSCDDCSQTGLPDAMNDGPDADGDGTCDAGETLSCLNDPGCVPVTLKSFEVADRK